MDKIKTQSSDRQANVGGISHLCDDRTNWSVQD